MSYSSRTPLKSRRPSNNTRQHQRDNTFNSITSTTTTTTATQAASSRPTSPVSNHRQHHNIHPSQSSPTSRQSSTSFEFRHPYHYHHQNNNNSSNRRSSVPLTPSRRPSGDSVVLAYPSSPLADDEYNIEDPVKEPDVCRPEVMRSATQLSISASLQELDRPLRGPSSPAPDDPITNINTSTSTNNNDNDNDNDNNKNKNSNT